jgi:integrase/recombinase XerD
VNDLAPLLQRFFTDKLMLQRQASPHTVIAYRDTFKLLLGFVQQSTGRHPARMGIADLDAVTISKFLEYLQTDRRNTTSTRNTRLAAIHSFFGYAALHAPEHAGLIQRVLAIPPKRVDRAIVSFLTKQESDALIDAPDLSTWIGRRDHTLLTVAVQTGLRVSELTGLKLHDVQLDPGAYVRCVGKGRKERCTPLTGPTVTSLRNWLSERGGHDEDPLFATCRGGPLSRDAVQHLVNKHAATATVDCPSMSTKNVTPHTLRHTCAMALLHAGVDITVIALWLGHESTDATQIYLHADMTIKERALTRTSPSTAGSLDRYKPPDTLLAFLENL